MLDSLTRRFGADYRVVPYLSPCSALAGVRKSKEENEEIALVIADQRMPEMTGRELLGRVRSIVPTAFARRMGPPRSVAYDTSSLCSRRIGKLPLQAVGTRGNTSISVYWGVLWTQVQRPGMELIRVIGDDQSTRSREIRELLNRNGIPYGFHQTGSISANRLIGQRGTKIKAMPALFLHDGTVLFDPTDAEIMDAVGESPRALTCDVAVAGVGPAELTAAVYAGSEGL